MRNLSVKQHNKYLNEISAIFEGEVLSLGEERTIYRKYSKKLTLQDTVQSVTFRVFRLWKGPEQTEITVEADVGSSCRFLPSVGSRLTVYSGRAGGKMGQLSINMCSVGVFDDQKMKLRYGEGKAIQQQPLNNNDRPMASVFTTVWESIVSFFS